MDKTFLGHPKGLIPKIGLALGFLAVLGTAGCANSGLVAPTSAAAVETDLSAGVTALQVTCKDAATGEAIVAVLDPSVVAHNATAVDKAAAACATINAVPATTQ